MLMGENYEMRYELPITHKPKKSILLMSCMMFMHFSNYLTLSIIILHVWRTFEELG
jgi:hypothetical protein